MPDASKVTVEYNDIDLKRAIIDEEGDRKEYHYDELGQITTIVEYDHTAHLTRYEYDNLGHRIKVIQEGIREDSLTTRYLYNELNQKEKTIHPDGREETYTYYPDDTIKTITDRNGHTSIFTYDQLGRTIRKTYPDGSLIKYSYDHNNNLTHESFKGILTHNEYDNRNRIIRQTRTIDNHDYTTEYRYDNVGNCTGIKYPDETDWLEYTYDDLNRLTTIGSYLTHVDYYPNDTIQSLTYGNTLKTTYEIDNRNRPLWIKTGEILQLNYEYDKEGNVLRENNNRYYYDPLDRLKTCILYDEDTALSSLGLLNVIKGAFGSYKGELRYTKGTDINHDGCIDGIDLYLAGRSYRVLGKDIDYSYDIRGNRLNKSIQGGGIAYTYYPNSDRLKEAIREGQTTLYEYDNNGNLIRKTKPDGEVINYSYDYENRLIQIYKNDDPYQEIASYAYDASGRRVIKSAPDKKTIYIHNQWGQVIKELKGTPVKYIIGLGRQIARIIAEETFYYHSDIVGSIRAITDETGNKVWWRDYAPFGLTHQGGATEGMDNAYQFGGKEYDQETGLVYFGGRYYDPELGRFITEDVVEPDYTDPQNINKYVYCVNNPLRHTDPNGLIKLKDIIKVVVAVVIVVVTVIVAIYCPALTPFATKMLIGELAGGIIGGLSAAAAGGNVYSGILAGVIVGGISGGLAGGSSEVLKGAIYGGGFGAVSAYSGGRGSTSDILRGFYQGAAIGAATGAAFGYLSSSIGNMKIPEWIGNIKDFFIQLEEYKVLTVVKHSAQYEDSRRDWEDRLGDETVREGRREFKEDLSL